jgi:hypothetical protein
MNLLVLVRDRRELYSSRCLFVKPRAIVVSRNKVEYLSSEKRPVRWLMAVGDFGGITKRLRPERKL